MTDAELEKMANRVYDKMAMGMGDCDEDVHSILDALRTARDSALKLSEEFRIREEADLIRRLKNHAVNLSLPSGVLAAIKFGDCIRKTNGIVEFAFEDFWNWLRSQLEGKTMTDAELNKTASFFAKECNVDEITAAQINLAFKAGALWLRSQTEAKK